MADQQDVTLSYQVQRVFTINWSPTELYEALSSFANTSITPEAAMVRRFEDVSKAQEYITKLLRIDRSLFFRPCLLSHQGSNFDVLGRLECGQSFQDWCDNNKTKIWIRSPSGALSLSPVLLTIFRQILEGMKLFHDQDTGHGNLKSGIMVVRDDEVKFIDMLVDCSIDPYDYIRRDLVDFFDLVQHAIGPNAAQQVSLVAMFEGLYRFLPLYTNLNDIRRFDFYVRNNPLFLDISGMYTMIRKMIDLYELDIGFFMHAVRLYVRLTDLRGCIRNIQDYRLKEIENYVNAQGHSNHRTYSLCTGAIVFLRNSLGHVKRNQIFLQQRNPQLFAQLHNNQTVHYHDGKVVEILLSDLPMVVPTIFLAMVRDLDRSHACVPHFGDSLYDFLQKAPTLFK